MVSTWVLSVAIRYGLKLHVLFGYFSAGVAFALATPISSLITYPLNASLIFRPPRNTSNTNGRLRLKTPTVVMTTGELPQ
jgi:hypothetical protein